MCNCKKAKKYTCSGCGITKRIATKKPTVHCNKCGEEMYIEE